MTDELKNKIENIVRRGILDGKSAYIIAKEIAEVVEFKTDAIQTLLEIAEFGNNKMDNETFKKELGGIIKEAKKELIIIKTEK